MGEPVWSLAFKLPTHSEMAMGCCCWCLRLICVSGIVVGIKGMQSVSSFLSSLEEEQGKIR